MLGSSTSNEFTLKAVVFAVAVLFLMPTCMAIFVEKNTEASIDISDEVLKGYEDFTGTGTKSNEEIWYLSGIYTPYTGGRYAYTPDGWLYGSRIESYAPSQYTGTQSSYTVNRTTDGSGVYRYTGTTYDGHKNQDLYSAVTMDVSKKSSIFFTDQGKTTEGSYYYYEYDGYRYSFSPLGNHFVKNADGDVILVAQQTSSCSMIWYDYYGNSGLAGQLVLSYGDANGGDRGTAYITSQSIIERFNAANNTAKFLMNFRGVDMNVYIRLNSFYLSSGVSIEDCWNSGYWEIMITSLSTDVNDYINTDYSLNVFKIWDTFIDLFTFNTSDYNITGAMGTIASLTISTCMYAILIALGLTCYPLLLVAGIVGAIQGLMTADALNIDLWPFW